MWKYSVFSVAKRMIAGGRSASLSIIGLNSGSVLATHLIITSCCVQITSRFCAFVTCSIERFSKWIISRFR